MKTTLIIAAAGIGSRFSSNVKKQFYEIEDKPILFYTLKNILNCYKFDELIIGANAEDFILLDEICNNLNIDIPYKFVHGGKRRVDTVFNCVNAATGDIVAVHDAVRPFVSSDIVAKVIEKASEIGGAICALNVRDTVKKVSHGKVEKTVDRDKLYLAHTPQAFNRNFLILALNNSIQANVEVTDESSAFEYMGLDVGVVDSNYDNIKVTYLEDISNIKMLLNKYKGV